MNVTISQRAAFAIVALIVSLSIAAGYLAGRAQAPPPASAAAAQTSANPFLTQQKKLNKAIGTKTVDGGNFIPPVRESLDEQTDLLRGICRSTRAPGVVC